MDARQGPLLRFASAAARNGLDLLSDAEVLCLSERWSRTYALAVLAIEELGKASAVLTLALLPTELRTQVPAHELLERHEVKHAVGLVMCALEFGKPGVASRAEQLADQLALLAGEARASNLAKQRGFYVDLICGELRAPGDITETEARAALAQARQVAESAGPLRNPDVLEVLSDPPPEVLRHLGVTMERFLESADPGGPEAAAAVALELARIIRQREHAPGGVGWARPDGGLEDRPAAVTAWLSSPNSQESACRPGSVTPLPVTC